MPLMIARNTVVLQRNGARLEVAPDTAFDFSSEEVKELGDVLRKPKNEVAEVTSAPAMPLVPTPEPAAGKPAGKPAKPAKPAADDGDEL